MKTKLIYALEALGILAFCLLPTSLEHVSLGASLAIITGALAVLYAGAKACNRQEE